MSSEKEKSTWKESPARVGTSVKNEKFPWKAFTFLALLTICLLTLFTHSIWKTVTDLEAQRKLTCESVKGNSDMYGLGIRLGVYMQLVVSAFVDSFGNQQYSSGLVASTLWFLFALSVALSMVLYNPASHSSEVYIIISLGNAVTAVMLSKMAKFNPLTSSESYLLALGRVVLWGVWRASTSVYWWTLIHDNYVEGSDSCGTWGWIFYKVDLNGPFRTFNQATNVLEWIILGSFLLSYLIGAIIFLFHLWRIEWPAGKDIRKADGGGRTKSKEEMRRVPASKFTIACDYAFVSIGKLRQTLYGVDETGNRLATPAASDVENPPPSIASDAENAQKNARSASLD
ncbi:hypothetical protein EV426DRAFT_436754 [Tirmania nivea]|nr:hypothetical protein EV426DRAFT_436754 [Tirmania nivea]